MYIWDTLHFVCACMLNHFSHVWIFMTPWTAAHQAPLFMGFSRQEYWSGLLCPPPRDLPDPGIKLPSLFSPALARRFFTTSFSTDSKNFHEIWICLLGILWETDVTLHFAESYYLHILHSILKQHTARPLSGPISAFPHTHPHSHKGKPAFQNP